MKSLLYVDDSRSVIVNRKLNLSFGQAGGWKHYPTLTGWKHYPTLTGWKHYPTVDHYTKPVSVPVELAKRSVSMPSCCNMLTYRLHSGGGV